MSLAIDRGLSVYGAAYLALASHERAPLATLDPSLAVAARAEVPALIGPLAD